MSCWNCGTNGHSDFCQNCGNFLHVKKSIRLFEGGNIERDNPVDLVEELSAPSMGLSNDDILSFRRELTARMKGSRLSATAQKEFIERLVPVFRKGLAGPKLFADWLKYWGETEEALDKAVTVIEGIGNPSNPEVQALRAQLVAELNCIVSEVIDGRRPASCIDECWIAASIADAVIESVAARVQEIKTCQWARTTTSVYQHWFHPEHMPPLLHDRAAATEYMERFSAVANRFQSALHVNSDVAKGMQERLDAVEAGAGALVGVREHQFFVGAIGRYMERKLAAIPWLEGDIKIAAADEGAEALASLRERAVERGNSEGERVTTATKTIVDHHSPINEADGTSVSAINVEELVSRQQFLRQLSEQKPGSAWVTAALGANWGAVAESLGKKK